MKPNDEVNNGDIVINQRITILNNSNLEGKSLGEAAS